MTSYLYDKTETKYVEGSNTRFSYRTLGADQGVPLLFCHRFRGTMDHWDPALLEAIAKDRTLIVFDSAGVGFSNGEAADNIAGIAKSALEFMDVMELGKVDLLGWSMGGMVALQLARDIPDRVRKLILAATTPGNIPEAPQTPDKVWEVCTQPRIEYEGFLYLFNSEDDHSRRLGQESLRRLDRRLKTSNATVSEETMQRQLAAIQKWLTGEHCAIPHLESLKTPTLVLNGVNDIMIHAYCSYYLSQNMPNVQLTLYPNAGHGFLFQYPDLVAEHISAFLR